MPCSKGSVRSTRDGLSPISLFQTRTRRLSSRTRTAAGALDDRNRVGRAGDQVIPPSEENDSNRYPVWFRSTIHNRPSGNSATTGSRIPDSRLFPQQSRERRLAECCQVVA